VENGAAGGVLKSEPPALLLGNGLSGCAYGENKRILEAHLCLPILLVGGIMRLEKRKPSGREKDEESIKLLEELREKLYVDDISVARRAAFNLSWKQEDGLDILKEALFSDSPRTAKTAAVYGLRNMHGRMKKPALALLEQGLKHRKADIRDACSHALSLTRQKMREKPPSAERPPRSGRIEIREIPRKRVSRGKIRTRGIRGMHGRNRRI
jgi:hypothetical protein